jgi:hypothetical protein
MAILNIKGVDVIVDDLDVNLINSVNWWYCKTTGYVLTKVGSGRKNRKTMALHRFILGDPNCSAIDHINRNKLDNRRSNLREVTDSENCKNKTKRKNTHSKYKGVSKNRGKWSVLCAVA